MCSSTNFEFLNYLNDFYRGCITSSMRKTLTNLILSHTVHHHCCNEGGLLQQGKGGSASDRDHRCHCGGSYRCCVEQG